MGDQSGKKFINTEDRKRELTEKKQRDLAREDYDYYLYFLDHLTGWSKDRSSIELCEKLYGKPLQKDLVTVELYACYPKPSDSDILDGSGMNLSIRSKTFYLPLVKVINVADDNIYGIKIGDICTVADQNVGYTLDNRIKEAAMLEKSRFIGSDSGRPTIKNLPTTMQIPIFANWDNNAFSISKFGKSMNDIATYHIFINNLGVPVKIEEHIKYYSRFKK